MSSRILFVSLKSPVCHFLLSPTTYFCWYLSLGRQFSGCVSDFWYLKLGRCRFNNNDFIYEVQPSSHLFLSSSQMLYRPFWNYQKLIPTEIRGFLHRCSKLNTVFNYWSNNTNRAHVLFHVIFSKYNTIFTRISYNQNKGPRLWRGTSTFCNTVNHGDVDICYQSNISIYLSVACNAIIIITFPITVLVMFTLA